MGSVDCIPFPVGLDAPAVCSARFERNAYVCSRMGLTHFRFARIISTDRLQQIRRDAHRCFETRGVAKTRGVTTELLMSCKCCVARRLPAGNSFPLVETSTHFFASRERSGIPHTQIQSISASFKADNRSRAHPRGEDTALRQQLRL